MTLLKALRWLSMVPPNLDLLQEAGAIATLVPLLAWKATHPWAMIALFYLCRINRSRQEQAARAGIVPHLQRAIADRSNQRQFALPPLCDLAHAVSPLGALGGGGGGGGGGGRGGRGGAFGGIGGGFGGMGRRSGRGGGGGAFGRGGSSRQRGVMMGYANGSSGWRKGRKSRASGHRGSSAALTAAVAAAAAAAAR